MVAGEDLWLSADQQDEWVNSKKQVGIAGGAWGEL